MFEPLLWALHAHAPCCSFVECTRRNEEYDLYADQEACEGKPAQGLPPHHGRRHVALRCNSNHYPKRVPMKPLGAIPANNGCTIHDDPELIEATRIHNELGAKYRDELAEIVQEEKLSVADVTDFPCA